MTGAELVVSSRKWRAADGTSGTRHIVWCPACDAQHAPTDAWEYDSNAYSPTFSPSILVTGGSKGIVCHSFLKAGVWQFLSDCPHAMAGQSVPAVPVPQWLIKEQQ